MTKYHSLYWALLLTSRGTGGSIDQLARSIAGARVDLNPHQVDAALFALRSPISRGAILADEVGLGKTIEAGLVIAQRWAERRRRILIIVPAILRTQWRQELEEKFFLPVTSLDARGAEDLRRRGVVNPFDIGDRVIVCSYHFASARAADIRRVPWDLVVIDEAHRLRNVYKPNNRIARTIAEATRSAPKLLLTATPLQNSLMELYGLVSVVDDQVFGDDSVFRDSFVRATNEKLRNDRLRERLRPICVRTLRKQVTEYIPFTRRIPITQDFYPSDDEQRLYESVSTYLQREDLLALPSSQRSLITLVLRKLLASSTFAIGPTLRTLADRLECDATDAGLFDDLDLEGVDELVEELDESEDEPVTTETTSDPKSVRAEIEELRRFAELADAIRVNAKGEALVPALTAAFAKAGEIGAPQKAVIFTESRRTQTYLLELLARSGFDGHIALINGTNSDPLSREIHHAWSEAQADKPAAGSRSVDVKAAIVEHFRDSASILIATEAAAEGVNLQFCALVVNFDLPWNPQRIEQRIGRCHRYGQKHDVVVVNFLNRRNAADQRVFQLLSEKFRLFDGVFGASDEVLGALESGVDIERRIAEIYRTCRSTDEITAAFDRIQTELDTQIQARMRETRTSLLEHFDEEVSERLRVHRDRTLETLGQRERWLLELTRFELGPDARFDKNCPRFEFIGAATSDAPRCGYHFDWREAERLGDVFYRQDHPLAQRLIDRALVRPTETATLTLDYTAHGAVVSSIKPLVGRSGWLALATMSVESFDVSEFVLVVGAVDDESGATPLDEEQCHKLLGLPSRVEREARVLPDAGTAIAVRAALRLREVEERNARVFDEEVLKLDRWSADLKDGLEREIKDIDRQVQEATREAALAQALAAKIQAQRAIRDLESARNRKRRELFEAQDEIDRQRDALIGRMEKQLACRHTIEQRYVVGWRAV